MWLFLVNTKKKIYIKTPREKRGKRSRPSSWRRGRKKLWVDKEKEGHEKAEQKQEVVQMQKVNLKNEERELMWL